ncbi:APC family permease [Actinoallomurus sp. NPDC050550]|uniref:APC family permease n=1 Tax=Actinoallomurus sp. NPDC050550 TaxID=3154937 RepID=UPI00340EEC0F
MATTPNVIKRVLLGRALRSTQLHEQLLPKSIALPVFASDPLSSVAYAPEQIFLTLSVAGLSAYAYAPWLALVISLVLMTVVTSYRQNVRAYTSGGGDFEVATTNLGNNAGLTVASALLVDYVLTVAVSVSSGVANVASAFPTLAPHRVILSVLIVVLLTIVNLRGVRESGTAFAIPTYAFIAGILGMVAVGVVRALAGSSMEAPSAHFHIRAEQGHLAGLGLAFLLLRAYSSGSAALTGVEAISNGVPAFRPPKGKNAATTLLMMGLIAISMIAGIVLLANITHLRMAEKTADLVGAPPGYTQQTVIAQISHAVFSGFPPGFYYVASVTGLILVLAANTAFNGFPVLGSILAQNRYLPRQLHTRGDRLAFSNGIIILATMAGLLIYAFDADVTRLLNLYIIGVFVSFTVSQTGMVRHWNRKLETEIVQKERRRMMRSRAINAVGATVTGLVLIVVLSTRFMHGAYIVCIAMPVLFLLMKAIRRHYDRVTVELEPTFEDTVTPARNHAVVLVSQLHRPTLRALAFARATQPSTLEAITVAVDPEETRKLQEEWDERALPVPLKILDSPYREVTRPVLEYVKNIQRRSPRDVVTVYLPEYVVGRWWEHLLHNQSALRLKGRLLFQPGVMVTSVPWQLASSDRLKNRPEPLAPGSARRSYGPNQKAGEDDRPIADEVT